MHAASVLSILIGVTAIDDEGALLATRLPKILDDFEHDSASVKAPLQTSDHDKLRDILRSRHALLQSVVDGRHAITMDEEDDVVKELGDLMDNMILTIQEQKGLLTQLDDTLKTSSAQLQTCSAELQTCLSCGEPLLWMGGDIACSVSGGILNCWGEVDGVATTVPAGMSTPDDFSKIIMSEQGKCIYPKSGGAPTCDGKLRLPPVDRRDLADGEVMYASDGGSCISGPNKLECWGMVTNSNGQEISGVSGQVTDVYLGYTYGCAVIAGTTLQCWQGSQSVMMKCGSQWSTAAENEFSAGDSLMTDSHGNTLCILKADKSLKCFCPCKNGWHYCHNSQNSPVPGDLGQVKHAAIGRHTTCAIKSDDTVQCWGRNTAARNVPANLGTVSHLEAAAGNYCAIRSDTGLLQCWGDAHTKINTVPAALGVVDEGCK